MLYQLVSTRQFVVSQNSPHLSYLILFIIIKCLLYDHIILGTSRTIWGLLRKCVCVSWGCGRGLQYSIVLEGSLCSIQYRKVFMVPPYHLLASGRASWGEGKHFERGMENSEIVLIPFSPNRLNLETISKREFLK